MSDEIVLRTVGLAKTYTDFWGRARVRALHGLDLEVRAGEVYGLLGPNGSGKTTTIKLLLGLLRPTAGDAFVFGRDPGDLAARHRLGYLPEETHLYRFLDAEQTLRFYGRLFGLQRAELDRRIDELITLVGLEGARRRRLGEYSKGMARRLGLAQALINRPDLVILDEPTSGLDPLGIVEVKELIQSLRADGTTVLLSSHLLADVEDVCDRIAILHNGVLREQGAVEELLARHDEVALRVRGDDPELIAALERNAGEHLIATEHPRERLEQHFRRIVAAATPPADAPADAPAGAEVADDHA
ncbi:MAG: ABC transporter ATP-binding protein [Planctomycetota bacterium]